MTQLVLGLFDSLNDAHETVRDLIDAGFPRDEISFIVSDAAGDYARQIQEQMAASTGGDAQGSTSDDKSREGVGAGTLKAVGAASGGGAVLGGLAGLLVGLGALAIPGIGPVLAVGPLYGAYVGATAGGVAGGFIGARSQWGSAEAEAPYYLEGVRRGSALVAVQAEPTRAEEARAVIKRHGPVDVRSRAEEWRKAGWQGPEGDVAGTGSASRPADAAVRAGKAPGIVPIEQLEPVFREHYQQHYGNTNSRYEDYWPAYEYGYKLANDGRYSTGDWQEVEPHIQRYWEQYQPGAWNQIRDAVHFGRDSALQRSGK